MKVTVKYFGMIAERKGLSEEVLETDIGSLQQLRQRLETEVNALKNMRYSIAVNQKMVSDNVLLNDGDEISFFPPFAGG